MWEGVKLLVDELSTEINLSGQELRWACPAIGDRSVQFRPSATCRDCWPFGVGSAGHDGGACRWGGRLCWFWPPAARPHLGPVRGRFRYRYRYRYHHGLPVRHRGRGGTRRPRAPDIVTAARSAARKMLVVRDGTPLPIDRTTIDRPYHSGKHHRHGMNVQVLADPFGRLLWASPALPGAGDDIRAARPHPRHQRDADQREPSMLGRQGISRRWRHHTRALLRAVGEALGRPAGPPSLPREDPSLGRTSRRHLEGLAASAEAAMRHDPHHRPGQSCPHPSSAARGLRLGKAHWRISPIAGGMSDERPCHFRAEHQAGCSLGSASGASLATIRSDIP